MCYNYIMTKNKISPELALTAMLPIVAQTIPEVPDPFAKLISPVEPRQIVLHHKTFVKSGITHKQPKPGKNRPAKGYNPETKTWEK